MSTDKQAKKELKARLKLAKREAAAAAAAQNAASAPAAESHEQLTPAERSARAAEKQVRLQHLRVVIGVAGVVIAAVTLLITLRCR